jgi:hypothetical protein
VKYGLNLLHLALLVGAFMCVRLSAGEMGGRCVRRARLAWPALLALFCAGIFLLFHVGLRQPAWIFGVALAVGLAAGAAKAFPIPLEVDHMFERVRLPPARWPLAAACLLAIAVVLEIAGSLIGAPGAFLRIAAAPLAAASAGVLSGRAVVIALRCRRAPHVVLHRF